MNTQAKNMNRSAKPAGVLMRRRHTGVTGPVLTCGRLRPTDRRRSPSGGAVGRVAQDAIPLFAHVGECCCLLEAGSDALDWMPLSAWLICLCNGAKLRWLKAGRLAVALGSIG